MSKREVSITLRAKNMLARGLGRARQSLQTFGNVASRIGKVLGGVFIAGGAAISAFSVKALSAYAAQEKAVNDLRAALMSYGDEVTNNTKQIADLAAAIQNETAVADENLIARAARLRMLGVEVDALGDAVKATVALESAGMGEEQAVRAIATAREGDFQMLQRYIPALRLASSETEKATILNDFLTRGYQQQTEKLRTVSGQWQNFKGRIGDLWEEFGRIINQNGLVSRALEIAAQKVKEFGAAIAQWADSKQFEAIEKSVTGIVNALAAGGAERQEAVKAIGEFLMASLARGAEIAGNYLKEIAPQVGKLIGAAAKAAIGSVAKENDIKQAAKDLGIEGRVIAPFGLGMFGVPDDMEDAVRARAEQINQERIFRELGIETTDVIEGQTAAQYRLAEAMANIGQIAERNAQGIMSAAAGETAATVERIELAQTMTRETVAAAEERADAEEQVAHDVVAANEQAAADVSQIWEDAAYDFLDSEQIKVDAARRAAGEISSAYEEATLSGGTFESSGDYITAKMRAAGLEGIPQGATLTTQQADALRQVTQEQILAELRLMNSNQNSLLRAG